MKKTNVASMGWTERFALIDRYSPSTKQICSAFGVSNDELHTAQEMRTAGNFGGSVDLNVDEYNDLFPAVKETATVSKTGSATTHTNPKTTKTAPPATATKKMKKRGRQGDKIAQAFLAVPSIPVAVDAFAAQQGVSLPVLRQSKRFDKSGLTGAVKVKKDKATKVLMIWREAAPAE